MSKIFKTAEEVSSHKINENLFVFDSIRYKRIPGFSQYFASEEGQIFKLSVVGLLTVNSAGRTGDYRRASMVADDGRYCKVLAHTAIGLAFIPKPLYILNPEIDHKNGIKDANNWKNLEWVSRATNLERARQRSGKEAVSFKKKQPVRDELGRWYESHTAAAKALNVSRSHISTVLSVNSYNVTAAGLRLYRA